MTAVDTGVPGHPGVRLLTDEVLDLGEGARWVHGRLAMVDIFTGRLMELTPRGTGSWTPRTLARLDVSLGAVAPVSAQQGWWVAAAGDGFALVDPRGCLQWLARPEEGTGARMNDGCCDPSGRFWAGSAVDDGRLGASTLYRLDPDGQLHVALRGLSIVNGPAFTADGTVMYLADSPMGTIMRYRVDVATGRLDDGWLFARYGPGHGFPDGMTVDDEDRLWVAVWGAGAVDCYAPSGQLLHRAAVPAAQPTSVAIGGPDGRTMVVTSAAYGMGPVAGAADGLVMSLPTTVGAPPAACYG